MRNRHRSLVAHVRATSGRLLAMLLATVVATVAGAVALIDAYDDARDLIALTRQVRLAHEAMLDQETGIRGYLLGGDDRFLEPYEDGRAAVDDAYAAIARSVAGDEELVALFGAVRAAADRWMAQIDPVAASTPSPTFDLRRFLDSSKARFDRYRVVERRLIDTAAARRDTVVARQQGLLLGGGGLQLAFLAATALLLHRHSRGVRRGVLRPVDDVIDVIGRMGAGELGARVPDSGFDEIRAVSDGLARLGTALGDEQARAALRAELIGAQADRFRELLRTSREISGGLDLAQVRAAVVSAARHLTRWSHADVRLVDEEALEGDVADVAASGVAVFEPGCSLLPMVLGGRVIGVLECRDAGSARLAEDVAEALTLLAAQAASAVEAARLHARLHLESRVDALTGLANRRSFDDDVRHELDRCRRYGRPLSVLLLDLDHFKRINDQRGHQAGDAVLHAVGALLDDELRSTDTAYRYGGEELVVLLRETALEPAAEVAERLRVALAQRGAAGVAVTASVGVAQAGVGDDRASIVARVDAALYEAKSAGRNCTVVARGELVFD